MGWLPWQIAWLSEALFLAGDPNGALAAAEEGLALSRASGLRSCDAQHLLVRGMALRQSNQCRAEQAFQSAIFVARDQNARSLELKAATSLADLLVSRGSAGEARQVLEPICTCFEGELETPDLRAGRALLRELG